MSGYFALLPALFRCCCYFFRLLYLHSTTTIVANQTLYKFTTQITHSQQAQHTHTHTSPNAQTHTRTHVDISPHVCSYVLTNGCYATRH